jgi:hypothetical protein
MVENTMENLSKTRDMGMVSSSGEMADSTRDNGPMENNMVRATISVRKEEKRGEANGLTERELSGLIDEL